MDLMDFLGRAFGGGGGDDADLQSQLIAQLGGDPRAMRNQAGLASLGTIGATMLANSAPSTEHKSFASILGQGLLAGQQGGAASQGQALNHLYMLENMKRAQSADAEAARKTAAAQTLAAQFKDPDFQAQLPETLRPYANILSALPPEQATQLIVQQSRADTAERKADAAAAKPRILTPAGGGIFAMDPQTNAVTTILPATGKPPQPGELEKAGTYLQSIGVAPDAIRKVLVAHMAPGLDKAAATSPLDKAAATATVKRIGEIDTQEQKLQALLDQADSISAGIKTGVYDTGGTLKRHYDALAPQSLRGDNINTFDSQTNQLVLDTLSTMKNIRGSNLLQQTIARTKPGVGNSNRTNADIIENIRGPIADELARIRAERDRYQNGATLLSPRDGAASGGGSVPGGVGAAPGSAGVLPGGAQVAPGAAQTSPTQGTAVPTFQQLIDQANAAKRAGIPDAQIEARFRELARKYGYQPQ